MAAITPVNNFLFGIIRAFVLVSRDAKLLFIYCTEVETSKDPRNLHAWEEMQRDTSNGLRKTSYMGASATYLWFLLCVSNNRLTFRNQKVLSFKPKSVTVNSTICRAPILTSLSWERSIPSRATSSPSQHTGKSTRNCVYRLRIERFLKRRPTLQQRNCLMLVGMIIAMMLSSSPVQMPQLTCFH